MLFVVFVWYSLAGNSFPFTRSVISYISETIPVSGAGLSVGVVAGEADGITVGVTDGAIVGAADDATGGAAVGVTIGVADGTTGGAADGTTDADGTSDGATGGVADGSVDVSVCAEPGFLLGKGFSLFLSRETTFTLTQLL